MPFLFIWSVLLATPLTLSSGAIGLANYMTYFFPALTGLQTKLIAVAVTLLAMVLCFIGASRVLLKFRWYYGWG
ncbi:hypothetical protein L3X07_02605 [Levilactobacillus brevis]|nr:hypothetical protein [Levilactobacillus brevis]